jgi:low temperature requirement protein LtrA
VITAQPSTRPRTSAPAPRRGCCSTRSSSRSAVCTGGRVSVSHAYPSYIHHSRPKIVRVAPFNIASALLVTLAGLIGGGARYPLWIAALVIQLGSPLVVHPRNLFELNPAHLAERHSALLIVALGESVASIGIGAAALAGQPAGTGIRLVASSLLGLALAAALWWIIFGGEDEERAQRVLAGATSERRTALALSALFYGTCLCCLAWWPWRRAWARRSAGSELPAEPGADDQASAGTAG